MAVGLPCGSDGGLTCLCITEPLPLGDDRVRVLGAPATALWTAGQCLTLFQVGFCLGGFLRCV